MRPPQDTSPPAAAAERKPDSYFGAVRTDMVPLLPDPLGRVLDVGCATGSTGRLLQPRAPDVLVGIEIDPDAAELARPDYDQVLVGSADAMLAQLDGPFDTILCYDVLEHLVDPWQILARLGELAAPGARLHVSVPNARHLSLMVDVMLRGTFNYQVSGHRDNTHLRWFTPRDIEAAVTEAGFAVTSRSHPAFTAWRRGLARVSGGRATEFLAGQWQVLAVRRPV